MSEESSLSVVNEGKQQKESFAICFYKNCSLSGAEIISKDRLICTFFKVKNNILRNIVRSFLGQSFYRLFVDSFVYRSLFVYRFHFVDNTS